MAGRHSVLVIGGSASIGPPVVQRFLAAGEQVVASYYAGRAPAAADGLMVLPLDLASEESIESFANALSQRKTLILTTIFLSSLLPGKTLSDYDFALLENVMAVNFSGQAKLLMRVLPLFADGAQILMIASIAAQRGSFDPVYAASKGAILSFVKALSQSLAPGVRVNAIAPGLIEGSTMFGAMSVERREFHRAQTPTGQLLLPDDLAAVVFDLTQEHWSHLNGACIDLNGGQYVR